MTTETKRNYTIDEVALWNAGINPDRCEGCVEFAAEDRLPGWELAVEYRNQLEAQILNGELIPSIDNTPVEHIVDDDQPTVSAYTPIETFHQQFFLSFEDAKNWRPAGNPFTSTPVRTSDSTVSHWLATELLIRHSFGDNSRGRQTTVIRTIQAQAEQDGLSGHNLSDSAIKRFLQNTHSAWKTAKRRLS